MPSRFYKKFSYYIMLTIATSAVLVHPTADANAEKTSEHDSLLKNIMKSMVWVEGGKFVMGSDAPEAFAHEKPAHKVELDGFYIAKHELTQGTFNQVMGWNNSYFPCEQCPVNNISWTNAKEFIQKLNLRTSKTFRLPTEAEWEYAAKGGQRANGYDYSGSNNISDIAWFAKNANKKSHPVALKKPNELGLYDMTGNLWEFCEDDMSRSAYSTHKQKNPKISSTDNINQRRMKVIRGGGYEFNESESLIFRRDGATNNVRMPDIGFRLAMSKD